MDLIKEQPVVHPTAPIHVAVVQPLGRDSLPAMANETLQRAILRPCRHPVTGQEVFIHPYPYRVIGDEYARGRNELVRIVFQAEKDATTQAQAQENATAKAENRRPGLAVPFKFDYMLWVDDDVMVPETVVEQLLATQGQVVSGLYFMRKPPHLPVAYNLVDDPAHPERFWNIQSYPDNSVIEVDATGMGCMLVATEVFRRMSEPWFAWQSMDARPDEHDHRSMGEDMYFTAKARSLGYKVLLSTGTICQHIGEYFYDETLFKSNQIHYYRRPPEGRMAICLVVSPAPKPWDGRSIYNVPLGGSESSVAYLARSLARLHHVVYVICSTTDIVDVDGVCYRPYASISGITQQAWDAMIIVRWPDAMTWSLNPDIKTLMFWAHDLYGVSQREELRKAFGLVAPGQTLVGDPLDAFVALTPWHAATCQIAGTNTPILSIPNGLDLSLFEGSEEKVPGRLIWTSNPNRGLMSAVRTFRDLRKRWPFMEFHIYGRSSVYGWSSEADPMHEKPYLPDQDELGVFVHDPLPKPQLARELMKAWAMFYTSTWPETFSLAVTEAQAAGTPVICTPYGALPETVHGGILTWDFEKAVEDLMNPQNYELLQLRGREFARTLSWDSIAKLWEAWIVEHNNAAR